MMDRTRIDSVVERALGELGLVLVALTGWSAGRLGERSRTGALAARLVLVGVTAVGWAVDRLPGPDKRAELRGTGVATERIQRVAPGGCST